MDSSLDSKQESEFALIPMDRKRDRSPSASSADESTTKMCLILGATIQRVMTDYVYAMILDPNLQTDADTTFDEDDFILNPQPTVRFDGLNGDLAAFCVSKSTLYIFESLHRSPSRVFYDDVLSVDHRLLDLKARRAMIAKIPLTKSVYSFDLALADSSMVVVQKSELQKVPDMWGAKIDAAALLTPQGKILVYSETIGCDFTFHPDLSEFEIYDPDTQVWIQLPPLYNHPPCDCYFSSTMFIVGSGFLSSSVFYISTSRGNYVIDVEENEKCWKKHELCIPKDIYKFYFAGVEGMCVTNFDVKSSKDWGSLCEYPDLSIYPEYIYEYLSIPQFDLNGIDRLIALVDSVDGGGCFSFCSVQSTYYRDIARDPRGPGIPFIMMDVFRANCKLIIPNEGVDKKLIISKKGCLKFSPRQLGNISRLFGLGLFTVQFRSFEGSETF